MVKVNASMSKDVWVYVEHAQGTPKKISLELLSCARALCTALGANVVAFVPGPKAEQVIAALGSGGPAIIYAAEHPLRDAYPTAAYGSGLADAVRAESPAIAWVGSTAQARDR